MSMSSQVGEYNCVAHRQGWDRAVTLNRFGIFSQFSHPNISFNRGTVYLLLLVTAAAVFLSVVYLMLV